MSNLIPLQNTHTMSSREIAGLTGKELKIVHRDIKRMLSELYGTDGTDLYHIEIKGIFVEKDTRNYISLIHLDREHSLTLVTGYDVKRRHAVNKRWLELEGQQKYTPTLIPDQAAVSKLETHLKAFELLGAPLHYAQIEAVKYVRNTTGVDYSIALTYAPAQNAIPPEEVMLEPTELGKRHGISAIALNRLLADHGYQKKGEKGWETTELGNAYCEKHSWSKRSKSGYNLKWRAELVDTLLTEVMA